MKHSQVTLSIPILLGLTLTAGLLAALHPAAWAAAPIAGHPASIAPPTTTYTTTAGLIRAVVAADLDTDGHPDLIIGRGPTLTIQANSGLTLTKWAQTVTVGAAAHPIRALCTADLDRDGHPDLVSAAAAGSGPSQLRLWRNPGDPFTNTWPTGHTLTTAAISLTAVAAADLDSNGTPDLVSAGRDGLLRLWDNPLTGTQPFTTPWPAPALITAAHPISRVLVADLDRDGRTDIIAALTNGPTGTLKTWHNPAAPFSNTWTVSRTIADLTATIASLALGDVDNDGAPDLAVGLSDGRLIVWRNPLTGTQPFTTAWPLSTTVADLAHPIVALALDDSDHDGYRDLIAAAAHSSTTLTVWRNPGQPFSSGWASHTVGAAIGSGFALVAADFNRDGDTDFITAQGDPAADTGHLQFWANLLIRSAPRFQPPNVSHTTNDPLYDYGLHAQAVHDLDHDGLADIVVATLGGDLIILHNDGTPFSGDWPTAAIGAAPSFFSVVVGDLDGDGWPDIATGTEISAAGNHVHIWQNDTTPFTGTWLSRTVGTFPRQVMDIALADVERQGHLQIVVATGITTTYETQSDHDVPVSADNRIWLLAPPAGNPFASAWTSSTLCTTTYSANSVAVGDLDNDGWQDILFGPDHAPQGTTVYPDTSGFYDGPAYQVRACRNPGTPYTTTWPTYDVGRDDAPVSAEYLNHQFWGAHVWSVALGDLNNDGYLDAASGGGGEGDYQVVVYENDGSPFDGVWSPTAVGYGSRTDGGPSFCPGGSYPAGCPWLENSITAVQMGDLNGDGYLDLLSGFGGSNASHPIWINTGRPFGATVTDTHWARYDIGLGASRPVYGVDSADLDRDGRTDIAAVSSWNPQFSPATGPLRIWRNLGGIVRHTFQTDYANTTIEDGDRESPLTFIIKNNGRSYDHPIELDYLRMRLVRNGSSSNPMSSSQADDLFQAVHIYRDANGDGAWQPSDTPLLTLTTFSLTSGWLTFDFTSGDPLAAISPTHPVTYFLVLEMEPAASQNGYVTSFRFYYTVQDNLLARDRENGASVSIGEDAWRMTAWIRPIAAPPATVTLTVSPTAIAADGHSTATLTATVQTAHGYPVLDGTVVTFTAGAGTFPTSPYTTTTANGLATAVLTSSTALTTTTVTATASITAVGTVTLTFVPGPRAALRINDSPGVGGSEVTTHTLTGDDTFTVYAAAYDAQGHFIANADDVTWGGTGVVGGHLSPTTGVSATTFTPSPVGTGTITVADGSGHTDSTDLITVTPGALGTFTVTTPGVQTAGTPFTVAVTAFDAHGNRKSDYTGPVTFSSGDPLATLPTDDGSGWTAGRGVFTLTFRTTGVQTYTVTDGGVSATSGNITVTAGALSSIQIRDAAHGAGEIVSTREVTAGEPLVLWAAGYDTVGNALGDVVVTWTGGGVLTGQLTPTVGINTTVVGSVAGVGEVIADAGGGIHASAELVVVAMDTKTYDIYLPFVTRRAAQTVIHAAKPPAGF